MIYFLIPIAILSHYTSQSPFHSILLPNFVVYIPAIYLFACMFAHLLLNKKIELGLRLEDFYLFPFVILLIGSILSLEQFITLIYIVTVYLFFIRFYVPKKMDVKYIEISVIISIVMNLLAILSSDLEYRESGLFNNPNIFGFYSAVLFLIGLTLNGRIVPLLVVAISLLFVYFSGSRTAMLGVLIVIFLNVKSKKYILLMLFLIVLFILFQLEALQEVLRFSSNVNELSSGRYDILLEAIDYKKMHSIYLLEDIRHYEELIETKNFHNAYLRFFLSAGLVFLILYVCSVLLALIYFYTKGNRLLLSYAVMFYVMSFFEDYSFSMNGYSFYMTIVILALSKMKTKNIVGEKFKKTGSKNVYEYF